MTIKISRQLAERIIREEVAGLREKAPEIEVNGEGEDEEKGKKGPKAFAPKEKGKGEKPAPAKEPAAEVEGDPAEKPAEEDPADDDLAQVDAKPEGEGEEGGVGEELEGKTIKSVKYSEKSKMMPGASEIVLEFDQVQDPFRVLVTKSGNVSYYFHGLHNKL